jgi:hypothetical protein
LKCKRFKEGWSEWEWRWGTKLNIGVKLKTSKPEWNLNKRGRVLLWAEQGIGDELMFLSLVPDLLEQVDSLIIKTDVRLIPLLKRTYGSRIDLRNKIEFVDESEYDYQIAMGSLPRYLRPSIKSFEEAKEFKLEVDQEKTCRLRSMLLDNTDQKLVGISWDTINQMNDSSLGLEEFILGIYSPGIRFICLQYGEVSEQIKYIREKHNIDIYEVEEIDKFNDIDGLASLISACDEVVTIENLNIFLANAVGINTNIILSKTSWWLFGIDDKRNYWFPLFKLFRQSSFGDWKEPLEEIKEVIKL